MNPVVKYTLARLGILLAVLLVLFALLPGLDPLVTLLVAFLVSLALSWLLLRGWRDEMATALAASAQRRREQRERLRAALAGEDAPEAAGQPEAAGLPDGSGLPDVPGPSGGDSGASRRADRKRLR